ncbi:MAG: type II toxin-antitoxin system prevent-host-death family antitoxin [Pseudomonadota bacterium]
MQVPVHAAKTQLSKLIDAALAGEEVVIAKGSTPVVRLVPVAGNGFAFGGLPRGIEGTEPDFLAPLSEDELADWGA